MITYQHPLTVIVPVDRAKLDLLRDLLAGIQYPDIESNTLVPFPRLKTVHFARFVILESETGRFPLQLAFSSNFDGEESTHIAELIREAPNGLHQIYSCCTGYQGDLAAYWAAHKVKSRAFYTGHQGLPLEQIRRENELRNAIAGYLDQAYTQGIIQLLPAARIKRMVADFIRESGHFEWAVKDRGLSRLQAFFTRRKGLFRFIATALIGLFVLGWGLVWAFRWWGIPLALGFLALVAVLAIIFFFLKWWLNRLEKNDPVVKETPKPRHVNALLQAENYQVQNQLSHLVEIKPGRFRLRLLQAVLKTIYFLARTYFNKGRLGSIPSIHFARWVMTDQNKRLLFLSNFDGSWENYLGDFIDKAAVGLTAVWSNTQNFPRSRNLVQEGARDEQAFKEWVRQHQIPTQVWYSAYKTLSVENINNNAAIRAGLFRKMNNVRAQDWLDRIYYYKT